MVLLVIGNLHFAALNRCLKYVIFLFLVFGMIFLCYLHLSLSLQEVVFGFQGEETLIQFDMTLIPLAKNSIVSLSLLLADSQKTGLWTKSNHVWCLADGTRKHHRKDC